MILLKRGLLNNARSYATGLRHGPVRINKLCQVSLSTASGEDEDNLIEIYEGTFRQDNEIIETCQCI